MQVVKQHVPQPKTELQQLLQLHMRIHTYL